MEGCNGELCRTGHIVECQILPVVLFLPSICPNVIELNELIGMS